MKINQKLIANFTGAALAFATIEAYPAQAAIITYDFNVMGTENFIAGRQYFGSLSYDDSSPLTSFGGFPLVDFTFDFEGQTYTEDNLLVDAGGYGGFYPQQGLETADLTSFNRIFFLRSSLTNTFPEGRFFASLGNFPGVQQSGKVVYSLRSSVSVPEPGIVGGLLFLSLGSLLLQKKKTFSHDNSHK
jgi:hypothetical protein